MEVHDIEENDEEYNKDMEGRDEDDMNGGDEDDTEESDEEYNKDMEPDKGELEDQEHDAYLDKIEQFELMADQAPPLVHKKVDMSQTQQKQIVTQTQQKQVVAQTTKQARKGRGPNKGLKVTEPMCLEYNDQGQPCGKWKSKYATHLGHCLRKISILLEWDEVPKGLIQTLWEDTVVSNAKRDFSNFSFFSELILSFSY